MAVCVRSVCVLIVLLLHIAYCQLPSSTHSQQHGPQHMADSAPSGGRQNMDASTGPQTEIENNSHGHTPAPSGASVNQHSLHSASGEYIMQMVFSPSLNLVILFDFWQTSSVLELAISCAVVFFLAVMNACLCFSQSQLHIRHLVYLARLYNNNPDGATVVPLSYGAIQAPPCEQEQERIQCKPNRCVSVLVSMLYSLHHMLKEALGVTLMLIQMSFNIWLISSTILGSGVGYILTSHMSSWRASCQKDTPTGPPVSG